MSPNRVRLGLRVFPLGWLVFATAVRVSAQVPPDVRYLEGHQGPIRAVAVSPDGKVIATSSLDRTIIVWDRESGEIIRRIPVQDQPLLAVDIAPDGRQLAAGGIHGVVHVFDLPLRYPLREFSKLGATPTALAVSADGQLLVSGDQNKALRLWNANAGTSIRDLSGATDAITAVALPVSPGAEETPGPRWVAAAAADGSLRDWNADTGATGGAIYTPKLNALAGPKLGNWLVAGGDDGMLRRIDWPPLQSQTLGSHSQGVTAVVLLPEGAVVTATANGTVQLFDAEGQALRQFAGVTHAVTSLTAGSHGRLVAAADDSGGVQLWSVSDGANQGRLTGHTGAVHDVAFHPQGKQLATAGADGTIRLWEFPAQPRVFEAHTQTIQSLAIGADGKTLITASTDQTVRRWNLAIKPFEEKADSPQTFQQSSAPSVVALRADGTQLATADAQGTIRLINPADGAVQAELGAHTGAITSLRYHPDEELLLSCSEDGTTKLWSTATAGPTQPAKHPGAVAAVAVSRDGTRVFTGSSDDIVRQFDATNARPVRSYTGQHGRVTSLALSPDEQLLAAASTEGGVRFWNVTDGADRPSLLGHAGVVRRVAFHPKGKHVATAGEDGTIRLWRLPEPFRPLAGHKAALKTVAVTPDGKRAMTLAEDVRLWSLADDAPPAQIAANSQGLVSATLRPDSEQVATGDAAGHLRLWTTKDGRSETDLIAHDGAVAAVAYRPDGNGLATGGSDGTVKLWTLPAAAASEPLFKQEAAIRRMSVSTGDAWIAAAGADGVIRLVEIQTGKTIRELSGAPESIRAFALSSDSSLLAASGDGGAIKLWGTGDGSERLPLVGHDGEVEVLVFHPDGEQIASAGADGTVRVWRLPMAPRPLSGHSKPIRCIAVSPDGKLAAGGGEDKGLRLWSLPEGAPVRAISGHAAAITAAAFAADSAELASGDEQGEIRLSGVAGGTDRGRIGAHTASVKALCYDPQGNQLFSGSDDGTVKRWQLPLPAATPLSGNAQAVTAVAVTGDAKRVVTGGADRTVRVFDAEKGSQTLAFSGQSGPVTSLALSPDASTVVSGDATGMLKLWASADGADQHAIEAHDGRIAAVAFSSDSQQIASAGADGMVRVWRRPVAPQVPAGHTEPISEVAVSPDGSQGALTGVAFVPGKLQVLVGAENKTLQLWDLESGKPVRAFAGNTDAVTCVAISSDGKLVASAGADKSVRVWWLADASARATFTFDAVPRSLRFSPDSARMVVGGDDRLVHVFDMVTGKLIERLAGHGSAVLAVDIAGDGKTVISASADRSARVWRLAATALWVAHKTRVHGAALKPDGTQLATVGDDKLVKLWDSSGKLARQLDGSTAELLAVAFRADGQQVAAAGADKHVYIWNTDDGKLDHKIPVSAVVSSLAYSADGKRLAAACDDSRLYQFDAVDGRLLEESATPEPVGRLAFSPDGQTILTTGAGNQVWMHTVALQRLTAGHKGAVRCLAFSPDGTRLLSAGDERVVRAWQIGTGEAAKSYAGHTDAIRGLAVSPDGSRLLSAGADGTVHIWDAAQGSAIATLKHSAAVSLLKLNTEGTRAATLADDGLARVWDLPTERTLESFAVGEQVVVDVEFASDGRQLFSAGTDGTLRRWPLTADRVIVAADEAIGDLAWSADGTQLVTGSEAGKVKLWTVADGAARDLGGADSAVRAIAIRRDNAQLAAATANGKVLLWKRENGTLERTITTPTAAHDVAYREDGSRIAVAGGDGHLRIYGTDDGLLLEETVVPAAAKAARFLPDGRSLLAAANNHAYHVPLALERIVRGHKEAVTDVVFSPDGSKLISGGVDKTVRLWNQADGKELCTLTWTSEAVNCVSLTPDGTFAIVAGGDKTVRLFRLQNGESIASLSHPATVRAVAPSSDSSQLATCGDDGVLRVWDLETGRELQRFSGHSGAAQTVAFAGNGKTLVTGGADGTSRVRTLSTVRLVSADAGKIYDAAWLADGKRLAVVGDGGRVGLWSLDGKAPAGKPFTTGSSSALRCVAVRRDGRQLAAGGDSRSQVKTVYVWNVADGQLAYRIEAPAAVTGVSFSDDNEKLAVGGSDGRVGVYRTDDGLLLQGFAAPTAVTDVAFAPDSTTLVAAAGNVAVSFRYSLAQLLAGHEGAVHCAAFAPGGTQLLTAGADATVRQWDLALGKTSCTYAAGTESITALGLSRDGKRIVAGSHDKAVRLWDSTAQSAEPVAARLTLDHAAAVRAMAVSADGSRVGSAGEAGLIRLWDVAAGVELEHFPGHQGAVFALDVDSDATTLVSGGADRTARRWMPAVRQFAAAHTGPVHDLSCSPDGTHLFSVGEDGAVVQWSPDLKVVRSYEGSAGPLRAVDARPTGSIMAAVGDDRLIRLWNTEDGKMLLAYESPVAVNDLCLADAGRRIITAADDGTIRTYTLAVNESAARLDLLCEGRSSGESMVALALAEDERSLFSASADKAIRHWLAASAPPRHEFGEHRGPVYAARFTPDSASLATAGADGTLRIWDLKSGTPLHTIEHGSPLLDVAFRPDGARLVTAGVTPMIRLFDAEAQPVKQFTTGLEHATHSVHFHPSGSYVLSGGAAKQWQMWSESSDTPVRTSPGHNGTIRRAVWNHIASRVASVDDLGELFIWDGNGRPLHHQRLSTTGACSLAYTPDGSQVAIATQDPRLILLTLPENVR